MEIKNELNREEYEAPVIEILEVNVGLQENDQENTFPFDPPGPGVSVDPE